MGKGNAYTVFVQKPEGKSLVVDLDFEGKAVSKTRIVWRNCIKSFRLGSSGWSCLLVAGSFKHAHWRQDIWTFPWLRTSHFLKKHSAACSQYGYICIFPGIPLYSITTYNQYAIWQLSCLMHSLGKVIPLKTRCAQRVVRGERSAARPGRTIPPRKTRYPLYRRLGGPQGPSERAENLVPTGIRSRTVQPVVQSLYLLSYPVHTALITVIKINKLVPFF